MRFMYVFTKDNLILTKNAYDIWIRMNNIWIIFQSTNNNANKFILSLLDAQHQKEKRRNISYEDICATQPPYMKRRQRNLNNELG